MGLLSKKTIVCERCGKEYEVRVTLGKHICVECQNAEYDKRNKVRGYVDYAIRMGMPDYSLDEMDKIVEHRENILNKYRQVAGISRNELQMRSDNYKKLSEEEVLNTLFLMSNSSMSATGGVAFTDNFFVPTQFVETIVDADDVFAVGYVGDHSVNVNGQEVIRSVVFTNDPYIPVFQVLSLGKLGFFDFNKSKSGREGVGAFFRLKCSNMTYPVQELKQLKKQIKSEGTVNGNIDKNFMLKKISDAESGYGMFNVNEMTDVLSYESANMMEQAGYIQDSEINMILHMDKSGNRRFWENAIKKFSN